MNHFGKRLFALLLALVLTLSAAPLPARAADTVIYDAAEVSRFQRSVSEVAEQYNTALRAGPSYINGSSASYYVRPASTSYPYDQGELTQDTLDAMVAMTNFLRWLEGAEPLQQGAVNNDGLQRGALIRNFDFNHGVSDDNKPEDMDQEFWNSGKVWHNILALGSTPRGSITSWCNEGYRPSSGSWDTVGHRYSLLQYNVSALEFGYAGRVAIGRMSGYQNTVSVPFTAFPSPGPMPVKLLNAKRAAWSLEPNRSLLSVGSADALKVTVTNAATGDSYECTKENGKLLYNTWSYEIDFVQPDCSETYYEAGSVYRVVVSGLTDKTSGNPAELRYQVEFVDLTELELTTVSSAGPNGWGRLQIHQSMDNDADLAMLTAALPDTVVVKTANGRRLELPLLSAWTLDRENRVWTAAADASALPDTVVDPEGKLNSVTLPYTVNSYTGSFGLSGGSVLGQPGTIRIWRYMQGLPLLNVYQAVTENGALTLTKRFDETSPNYSVDSNNYAVFSLDAWAASDSGRWFAVYYGSESYYSDAWVTPAKDITVICTHANTRTERVTEPSCTEAGLDHTVCTICGAELSQAAVPALRHDFGHWTRSKEPSCTDAGTATRACSRCGETETRPVDALGHKAGAAVEENRTEPGCTAAGRYEAVTYCSVCGAELSRTEKTIPALGHSFGGWTRSKEPSCTEAGTETRACSRCGETETRPVDALGHSWDGGKVTTPATESSEGVRTYTCTRCGKTRTEKIPALNPFRFDDVKDPKAYYFDAVYWAYNHKPYQVTAGIDKTHFGPDRTVTRAQAMTFFWAAKDRPKFKKASTQFVDVKKTDWYYKSVMWAVENGITAGTDATHFSPNKTCNRGEILAFLYAAMKKPKVKIANPYKDVTNQWYRKAALWAYEQRIEKGENGKFNASTPCTRGSTVTYLYRFLERKSLLD